MNKLFLVTKYTFLEIYKSKIMLSVLILGVMIFILSYVASELSYGVPERVALDFGFGALSLSSVGMAIFIGVNLLAKELEHRTLYMVLSRPLRREIFVFGKLLGLSAILLINVLVLGIISIAVYLFLGGAFQNLLPWVPVFIFLESLLVLLFVVFFSLITNITMSVIYTLLIYVAGHALSGSLDLPYVKGNPLLEDVLSIASWVLPNFSKINLKDFAIYQQELSTSFLCGSIAYVLCYCSLLLILILKIFSKKNLD